MSGGAWAFRTRPGGSAVRFVVACAAACVLVAGAAAQGSSEPAAAAAAPPDIVARVNGEPIMRAEWQRTLTDPRTRALYQRESGGKQADSQAYGRWVLQKLIVKHLTLQEAARRNFVVSDDELDKAVEAWKAGYKGGPKGAQKYMKSRGLNEAALRETLRNDMLVARVTSEIIKDVKLTDKQVRAYYDRHKAELQLPEEVLLKVISLKDKTKADSVVVSLRNGEPFETLAREVSTEPRAVQLSSGRWIPVNAMPPALRGPVAALKPGENTEVLQGGSEYYIVRLEDRRAARTQTLDEARPQIEKRLLPEKQKEALQAWLRKQEKKAKVEILVT
jgi:parvulin-like peptidyl-prolyl isomerase